MASEIHAHGKVSGVVRVVHGDRGARATGVGGVGGVRRSGVGGRRSGRLDRVCRLHSVGLGGRADSAPWLHTGEALLSISSASTGVIESPSAGAHLGDEANQSQSRNRRRNRRRLSRVSISTTASASAAAPASSGNIPFGR